jgi:hypothetical protein
VEGLRYVRWTDGIYLIYLISWADGKLLGVTGARRDNVGCRNKEYYLCNLYNCTRVRNHLIFTNYKKAY